MVRKRLDAEPNSRGSVQETSALIKLLCVTCLVVAVIELRGTFEIIIIITCSMVRRIPSQVHQQAARLLRSKYLQHEPAWYQAVLAYPPIPLPSRAPPSRSSYDLPPDRRQRQRQKLARNMTYGTPKPLPIHYLEDDVRRQFFRDHPFEAFRPVTLVEAGGVADEHPIVGKEWTRLRQRGRNPSPEEYVERRFFDPSQVSQIATPVQSSSL